MRFGLATFAACETHVASTSVFSASDSKGSPRRFDFSASDSKGSNGGCQEWQGQPSTPCREDQGLTRKGADWEASGG